MYQSEQIEPLVYMIILNWNGWADTIECLESVFRNEYPNYRVIVIDNNSYDGSLEHIKSWAEGRLDVYIHNSSLLRSFSFPPVQKPIRYVVHERDQDEIIDEFDDREIPLVLIQTGENLGFAGGSNVGLSYALACKSCEYIWLLNNDTIIEPEALKELYKAFKKHSDMGVCGSCLRYYHDPSKIQAYGGGHYNSWLGTTANELRPNIIKPNKYYVSGASMFTHRDFLTSIGLLCEDYFIYYEEIDWLLRALNKYRFDYAIGSVVYHKEGSSIKAGTRSIKTKSLLSDYFSVRNRLLIVYKYSKIKLIITMLTIIGIIVNRLLRKQYNRVWLIIKLAFTFNRNLSYHYKVLRKYGYII